MHGSLTGRRIRVRGTVQGVGFRPFVWRLARDLELGGNVCNDAEGVLIEIWGAADRQGVFERRLRQDAPPLARIEALESVELHASGKPPSTFTIVSSRAGEMHTAVAADAATCPDCLAEIFDPADRRHGYPFTNCTHCGPRFSIVRTIPYDRANTSMAPFPMCERCRMEYEDPSNRRFHAQPNACQDCGPRIWLEKADGTPLDIVADEVVETAVQMIVEGRILAIKGIGGIHLACDAASEKAVAELRRRKQRHHKALALMARNLRMISRHAVLTAEDEKALTQPVAPIVILQERGERLASGISPGQNTLGFMLPYTPLHHLLMAQLEHPIVLTSGNLSDEPQCIRNEEARQKLGKMADYLLLHDREILTRLDDSVVRIIAQRPRLLRRARGYASEPMTLTAGFWQSPRVLAMGAELKSTFCLLGEGKAVLSQHLGDLENTETFHEYRRMLKHYQRLHDFEPELIVVDKHPNYLSAQLGRRIADEQGLPLLEVQHHHAHLAASMAEHQLPADSPPVLGLILDGLGYGDDGTLWGGEFLLGDYRQCRRLAHFRPVPMPGGAMAMREPWRNALAQLVTTLGWERVVDDWPELDIIRFLQRKPLRNLLRMLESGINSPPASSAGRLFDALAAVLGICREMVGFEGQAAMELEALAETAETQAAAYDLVLTGQTIDFSGFWTGILDDLKAGEDKAVISARFHSSLAHGLAGIARELGQRHGVDTLVLGGGVFQNKRLLEQLLDAFPDRDMRILVPNRIPVNDGGISLGQAVVAGATQSGVVVQNSPNLSCKRVFDLVKDFGTSESPKSTRSSTTQWCPGRPGHPAFGYSLGTPFGAFGTSGIPCRFAATGDYPPSLRSPWRAAKESIPGFIGGAEVAFCRVDQRLPNCLVAVHPGDHGVGQIDAVARAGLGDKEVIERKRLLDIRR